MAESAMAATLTRHPFTIDAHGRAQLNRAIARVRTSSLRQFLLELLADIELRKRLLLRSADHDPVALMTAAANYASANPQITPREKEALHTAALVARVPDLLWESACLLESPNLLDGPQLVIRLGTALRSALNQLETRDPPNGWLVRNAVGLGVYEDQNDHKAWHAARLQAVVALAWSQAGAARCTDALPRRAALRIVARDQRVH
ncbi:MAG: hypothetical protein IPO43_10285 [Rhodoferax sp.]|nr:hypothetical protein [Rhodoferax sp.]